jgi:maltooligosyltrehalose trehalohydrolase
MKKDMVTGDLGAIPLPDGSTLFRVWVPRAEQVALVLPDQNREPVPLTADPDGYFSVTVTDIKAGERYWYLLDGTIRRPDPASQSQPDGVHGPSQVVDHQLFSWSDQTWPGVPLEQYIIYELHVGAFTREGTFDGVISRLDYLIELGITAVELMPVAQFPGDRNWGYDGTFPFAPQNSYGGPDGLKRLVDACHARGLAVILDVVYNHLGPEGNYLHGFGPYFTDRYRTPWGDAVNFDGPDSDPVRHYFISNALHWITRYHIDALRLDAIHGIYDFSALHILQELTEAIHCQARTLGRPVHVIAESDLNDVRIIKPVDAGGYGLDAQWCDDLHHSLRALLTGERAGYYQDFGRFEELVKALTEGFVLSGQYSSFRKRRHGSLSAQIPSRQLVVFSQNHDQVGNRMRGERLSEHLSTQQLLLAAATVLLSPYLPLLFMGEEYAETAPFPYFVSHGDANLVESVRKGRLEEFAAFGSDGTPPDPQAVETFLSAKLDQEQRHTAEHRSVFDWYRDLIRLRKELFFPVAFLGRAAIGIVAREDEQLLVVTRTGDTTHQIHCLLNYSDQERTARPPLVEGTLTILFDSTKSTIPDRYLSIAADHPDTFPVIAPFGVIVYQMVPATAQGES